MKQIQNTGERAHVQSVLMLTDGNATDGITKPSDILNEINKLQNPPTGENAIPKVSFRAFEEIFKIQSKMRTGSGMRNCILNHFICIIILRLTV